MIYTFRSIPFKRKMEKCFLELFVFGKLNDDFKNFSDLILLKKPQFILGIANSKSTSKFEKFCINKFNKNKRIICGGKDRFELFVLDLKQSKIKINSNPSDSFCNWTMYKILDFINRNNLDTKLVFIHLNEKALEEFIGISNKYIPLPEIAHFQG